MSNKKDKNKTIIGPIFQSKFKKFDINQTRATTIYEASEYQTPKQYKTRPDLFDMLVTYYGNPDYGCIEILHEVLIPFAVKNQSSVLNITSQAISYALAPQDSNIRYYTPQTIKRKLEKLHRAALIQIQSITRISGSMFEKPRHIFKISLGGIHA